MRPSLVFALTLGLAGSVLVGLDGASWTDIPAIVLLMVSGAIATREDLRRSVKRNTTA